METPEIPADLIQLQTMEQGVVGEQVGVVDGQAEAGCLFLCVRCHKLK